SAEPSTVNIVSSEMRPPSASFAHRPTIPAEEAVSQSQEPTRAVPAERPTRRRRLFRAGVVFLAALAIGFFVMLNREALTPAAPMAIGHLRIDGGGLDDEGGDDDDDGDAGEVVEDEDDDAPDATADATIRADASPVARVRRPYRPTTHPAAKKRVRRPTPPP